MNRDEDFWLDVLTWCVALLGLALVGSVVLHAIECDGAAVDAARGEQP